jgi:N5-(cytidine 5'-diphosphoramidyl)-L-glutamine hydrolase
MNIYISSNFKKHFNTHIDFLDHNWINFFNEKNFFFRNIPNSIQVVNRLLKQKKKIDLIILPGGNDLFGHTRLTKTRFDVEKKLIKFSIKKKIPLLGICRGMQVINYYFGGKIVKIKGHMKKKNIIDIKQDLFKKKKILVNCFHNYCITQKSLCKNFSVLGTDKDKNIEMFKHNKYKILGVMWHPEREKNYNNLEKIIHSIIKK